MRQAFPGVLMGKQSMCHPVPNQYGHHNLSGMWVRLWRPTSSTVGVPGSHKEAGGRRSSRSSSSMCNSIRIRLLLNSSLSFLVALLLVWAYREGVHGSAHSPCQVNPEACAPTPPPSCNCCFPGRSRSLVLCLVLDVSSLTVEHNAVASMANPRDTPGVVVERL